MKARRPKKGDGDKEEEGNGDKYVYVCKLVGDTSQKKMFALREANLNRDVPASDGIDLVSLMMHPIRPSASEFVTRNKQKLQVVFNDECYKYGSTLRMTQLKSSEPEANKTPTPMKYSLDKGASATAAARSTGRRTMR